MQPVDECECKDILTVVGNFVQLALKIADVGLESITLPHLYGEDVMVVLLCLPMRGVLSEECLCYFLEVVERTRRQRVEPI